MPLRITLCDALQFCYHAAKLLFACPWLGNSPAFSTLLYNEVSHMNQYSSIADECYVCITQLLAL